MNIKMSLELVVEFININKSLPKKENVEEFKALNVLKKNREKIVITEEMPQLLKDVLSKSKTVKYSKTKKIEIITEFVEKNKRLPLKTDELEHKLFKSIKTKRGDFKGCFTNPLITEVLDIPIKSKK